jgi:hypothetical protein
MRAKLILGAFALVAAAPVSAALITWNFNPLVQTGEMGWNPSVTTDLLSGANTNTSALNTYMGSQLAGTTVSGALATRDYLADGNLIPGDHTLGTTDGATSVKTTPASVSSPDGFLMNNNVLGSSNAIVITIPAGVGIGTVSFDWEIFPNANCTSSPCTSNTGNPNFPTLVFEVDGTTEDTLEALTSAQLAADGFANADPQNLGTASLVLNIAASAHPNTLTFLDWPPEIGIDNLTIQTCANTDTKCLGKQTIPEPSPLPLTGLALALLALVRWKARHGPALAC